MKKYNSRAEVEEKYKWDLTEFFKNEEEFEKSYNKCVKDIEKLKSYVGCTKDSNKLYEFLEFDMHLISDLETLYIYAYLINDQELGISKNIERKNKMQNLWNEYSVNESFFSPELLELTKEEYDKLYKDNSKLNEYKKCLDDIYRRKEHVLPKREEDIISKLLNATNNFDDMSSTMLNGEHDYGYIKVDDKNEKITSTNLAIFYKNENRSIRKKVREKYSTVLGQYGDSSASFLNGYVKANITATRLHNYKDAWDAKLFNLKMPNEAYEKLIETVEKHVDSLQNYFRVFKKILGLNKLYQYDLGVEVNKNKKEYSIEDAQKLCLEAVKPLGEDYINHFKKIFDNHYIDYACYPKKASGGYSYAPIDLDSRIFMSYNYDLTSVSTIAHEGGHNVHHQYARENNPLQYREVTNLVAEVASLTNECLLSSYLAKNGESKDEKMAGIDNILGVIISNLFGAVREGKMELDFYNYVSEGNTITKDYMNDLTLKGLKKYYGKSVQMDEYSSYSWMRRSHYYMNYYLFNYAFCISVASSVAKKILDGDEEMLDKYIEFLKTGSDVDPMDVFKILDVDLTKKEVYENAIKYFDEMVAELEKLI